MKVFLILTVLLAPILAAPKEELLAKAEECDESKCKLPDCRCSSTNIPGDLNAKDIPQLVYFTFDDAVTALNYEFYQKAFAGKKNPDGCPVAATFFVSHEYTDYSKVHALHAQGHEIALHSITHTPLTDYWRNLDVKTLVEEFEGEIEIINKFGNIPKKDIKGIRLPLLQLSGNNSFQAIKESGLLWDCSWPTRESDPGFWPYTLDFASTQDCPVTPCPDASIPGVWVLPMAMWKDDKGYTCSMVDACTNIPTDEDGIFNFMVRNFETHYNGSRTPFGAYMHAAWFGQKENAFKAYQRFVDHILKLEDVYAVSLSRGLEWVRNPTTLKNIKTTWPECQKTYPQECKPKSCRLRKEDEERYMTICNTECPLNYPWLTNPKGN